MEYTANEQLIEVLKRNGFIEATSKRDKIKGKKSFKLKKHARKEIYFDYINIQIIDSIHQLESRVSLTEQELKNLIFYFKLHSLDKRELVPSGYFNFKEISQSLQLIEKEKEQSKKNGMRISRKNKIKRITELYESVTL